MFYNEFEVYNAYIKSGKPTFSWLSELDKWIAERYGVRFTPIFMTTSIW